MKIGNDYLLIQKKKIKYISQIYLCKLSAFCYVIKEKNF